MFTATRTKRSSLVRDEDVRVTRLMVAHTEHLTPTESARLVIHYYKHSIPLGLQTAMLEAHADRKENRN